MAAIVYLVLGCIPPLVAGPLAGMAYIEILKRRKGWYQIPFWVFLFILNLLVMYWVASSSEAWASISSSSAFLVTPVAAIATVFVMRSAWRRLAAAGGLDAADKRRFNLGRVLIPVLQIEIFLALLIYGPPLCKAGLVICRGV
jgi:hypothetical protein